MILLPDTIERKVLLDRILKLCEQGRVPADAACSAALYVSARAAHVGLHMSLDSFLEFAKLVYEDVSGVTSSVKEDTAP
jgi:hypothetical protein